MKEAKRKWGMKGGNSEKRNGIELRVSIRGKGKREGEMEKKSNKCENHYKKAEQFEREKREKKTEMATLEVIKKNKNMNK